jgi:hypothetical protein
MTMSRWKTEPVYMPPGIQVGFEIDGEIFRDDANPAVLRMRRTVARGLRERWPREKILEQVTRIGKFRGSAELVPGVTIRNGREDNFWTLTLRPDRPKLTGPEDAKVVRSPRRAASSKRSQPRT